MTREESIKWLSAEFMNLDEDDQQAMLRLVAQTKRARAFGLCVRFDEHTCSFYLADATTSTVVAPPPLNLPTITALLDDYEQQAAEE